ncbi:MAG: biopolymer transporter ExbD [Chitinophagaceae bacterium]|nr:biopolymer transporter ExbD [Chitinophagaceae bacterium]
MNLVPKNKIDVSFSMSSMTDIIFLLLIFFMLTSNFITPSGLPVNLPSSKSSTIVLQKVSVTITKNIEYYVNDKLVRSNNIESELKKVLDGSTEGVVVLHIDESVPSQYLVKVAGIASSLKAKVSIATKPE